VSLTESEKLRSSALIFVGVGSTWLNAVYSCWEDLSDEDIVRNLKTCKANINGALKKMSGR